MKLTFDQILKLVVGHVCLHTTELLSTFFYVYNYLYKLQVTTDEIEIANMFLKLIYKRDLR